jgi:hypothetical protein
METIMKKLIFAVLCFGLAAASPTFATSKNQMRNILINFAYHNGTDTINFVGKDEYKSSPGNFPNQSSMAYHGLPCGSNNYCVVKVKNKKYIIDGGDPARGREIKQWVDNKCTGYYVQLEFINPNKGTLAKLKMNWNSSDCKDIK